MLLTLHAPAFMGAIFYLESGRGALVNADIDPDYMDRFISGVEQFQSEMGQLPVSLGLKDQAVQLLKQARSANPDRNVLLALSGVLGRSLQHELGHHLFLIVEAPRRSMWMEPEKWFGVSADKFLESRTDMRDCARSLAVEQGTASVFHAMRIAERGLQWLAQELEVSFELENWKNVIDQIEKKIRDKEQKLPKGEAKSEQLKFYATASSHFWYMKEAWRNHVSHSRDSYDPDKAQTIVTHVRDFMNDLAGRV